VSDIDTAVVDSLKVLDLKWPIREADIDHLADPKLSLANIDHVSGPRTEPQRSPLVRSRATDGRECVPMPGKMARSAPRPPFGLAAVPVTVGTSRLSCGKAVKREYSRQFGSHPGNPGLNRGNA
jgi:hypothetical protein